MWDREWYNLPGVGRVTRVEALWPEILEPSTKIIVSENEMLEHELIQIEAYQ
jgi:hypothetical protein